MRVAATFLTIMLLTSAHAQSDVWHTGKLLRIDKDIRQDIHGSGGHVHTASKTYWTMQIEDGHIIYYAEGEGSLPHVTENAPIEWRLEKEKVRFKDENGKEHKINLQKKRAE